MGSKWAGRGSGTAWLVYVTALTALLALVGVASVYAGLQALRVQTRQNTRRVMAHITTLTDALRSAS